MITSQMIVSREITLTPSEWTGTERAGDAQEIARLLFQNLNILRK